jgi:hypothetical protein
MIGPILFALPLAQAAVTSPAEHLGRPVGRDFELADWNEVSSYHRRLAAESPRVIVETVGETTEGRDFLVTTISSEENLARLPELRERARRIADPRGLTAGERERLLADAKPILFISLGMHSTETAAPQFGMELAYRLATSDDEPYASARREMVVLIAPCLNPDGLDHVVSWYRETVGTPYEGSDLLELYQRYAGHDNNRDWFMLTQRETQIVTRLLYHEWFPQVYWDVHQQGTRGERIFVPPFRDPLNPNLDPAVIAGIDQLGTRALFDMTREGLTGVATGVTYDMWWNGGNRNVPVRHNVIGLLTEAASVNLASPLFLPREDLSSPRGIDGGYEASNRFPAPWPGGWWHLRDIIDYEHAFARSLLGSIAREPLVWLESSAAAAERAVARGAADAPRGWILPADNVDVAATRRLVDALMQAGVEIGVAELAFEADGREWPAASIVIDAAQPYGTHVRDLFEVQAYPEGDPPYDVAGWTLPFLLGVRRVEVMGDLDVAVRPVTSAAEAVAGLASDEGDPRNGDAWRRIIEELARGGRASLTAGRLYVGDESDSDARVGMPRIGIYAPYSGSMDEGWLRYAFESFGLPYVRVRNEMLRAGELDELLDVLVIASESGRRLDEGRTEGRVPPRFAGGLDPEGAVAIEAFVRGGGNLICIDGSAEWAIELFDLPLENVTRGGPPASGGGGFSCPGSVLRTVPASHVLSGGLPESVAVFFSRSSAWRVVEPEKPKGEVAVEDARTIDVLLRYAPTRVLLSGWIRAPEVIAERAAWVRAGHGSGVIHLFGFRPQYRGWSQQAFHLLFRAVLIDG